MDGKGATSASWHIERREMLAAGFSGATLMVLPSATTWAADANKPTYVYVGSYTKDPPGGGSNNPIGLSVFHFDSQSGALTLVQQVPSANPSFVALDPTKRFLYVVNEIDDYEERSPVPSRLTRSRATRAH
jgi:6-phosphogluconolactonase